LKFVWFLLGRLLQLVPVLIGITAVAFLLLRVMPGDPATLMLGARGNAEDIAALTRQLGLDRPLLQQYAGFLGDVATGSFGMSIASRRAVGAEMLDRLGPTLALVGLSTLIAVVLTVPLALLSAVRRGRWVDQAIKLVFIAAMSMPAFWLGLLLVLLLSIAVPIFPVSGYGDGFLGHLHHLVLPSIVIGLGTAALTIRALRSSIIGVLGADYIDTARAKGLPERSVLWRHVLRNSLMSSISILAVHTSWVIGGTVVVETVFGIPGLGHLLVSSIAARDYPVVQGLTVTFALLVVAINLLADVAYVVVDPRLTLS